MWGWVLLGLAAPFALYVRTRTRAPWALGLSLYLVATIGTVTWFHAWENSLHGHQIQALLGMAAAVAVTVVHVRSVLSYARWCTGIVEVRTWW